MKIESKHGMKKPAYTAVAAMMAASALISGCGVQLEGEAQPAPTTTLTTPSTDIVELAGEDTLPPDETERYLPVTREYFEDINEDYKRHNFEHEIGPYDYLSGSGVPHYVWRMEDGSEAYLYFSGSDEKICRITIVEDGVETLVYNRWDDTEQKVVLHDFFAAFENADYVAMKQYCTPECVLLYFREDDVNGLENAKLIECGYGSFEDDECFIYVTVETTGADNTVTTSSFYVVIVSEQDTWLIDRFQTER